MDRTTVRNWYRRMLRFPLMAYGVFPAVEKVGLVFSRTKSKGRMAPVVEDMAAARFEVRPDLPAARDYFTPSLGEMHQEGEHVWRAPWFIRRFYDAATNASIARGKEYFGMLYGCQRIELPPTLAARVPNGRVDAKTGFMLSEAGDILRQSNFNRLRDEDRHRLSGVQSFEHERVEGECLNLLHPWSTNYAHWLLDLLPRVVLAQKFGFEGKVLIPSGAPKFLSASLNCLGIASDRIVETGAKHIQAEVLFIPCPAGIGLKSRPEYLRLIGDKMRAHVGKAGAKPSRRLYISRKAAERSIANENEIKPILERHGFEVLQPEHMSFEEQVAAFSEAEVLLGPHGAGMYNSLFMRPPAMTIEILNEARWEISVLRLCRMLGLEHWHIHAKNLDYALWTTYCEPKAFEASLVTALDYVEWKKERRFESEK